MPPGQLSLLPQLLDLLPKRSRPRYFGHPWCGPMKDRSAPSLLLQLPPELLAQIACNLDAEAVQDLAVVCRELSDVAKARLWRWLDLSVERERDVTPDGSYEITEDNREAYVAELERRQAEQGLILKSRLEAVIAQGENRWSTVERFSTVLRAGCDDAIADILSKTAPTLRSLQICAPYDQALPSVIPPSGDGSEDRSLRRMKHIFTSGTSRTFPSLAHIDLSHQAVPSDFISLLCQVAPYLVSLQVWVSDVSRWSFGRLPIQPLPAPPRITQKSKLRRLSITHTVGIEFGARPRAIEVVLSLLEFSPGLEQLSLAVDSEDPDPRFAERISALGNLRDFCWRMGTDTGFSGTMGQMPRVELPKSAPSLRRLILGCNRQKWQFPTTKPGEEVSLPMLKVAVIHTDRYGTSSAKTSFPPAAPVLPLKPGFARWLEARPHLHSMYFWSDIHDDNTLEIFHEVDAIEAEEVPNARIQSLVHGQEELLVVHLMLHDITVAKRRNGKKVNITRRVIYGPDQWRAMVKERVDRAWQVFTSYKGAMVPMDVIDRIRAAEGPGKVWDARRVEVGKAAWQILKDWRAGVPASEIEEEEEDNAPSEADWSDYGEDLL